MARSSFRHWIDRATTRREFAFQSADPAPAAGPLLPGISFFKPAPPSPRIAPGWRGRKRDIRFVQLFHRGWDHHSRLPDNLKGQCRDVDQPTAALLEDLRQRGLLEDTLVIFAGEFGRTVYGQGNLTPDNYGRDHHPWCFSAWLAGGGIKGGIHYGKTDDFSYNIVENPVYVQTCTQPCCICSAWTTKDSRFRTIDWIRG